VMREVRRIVLYDVCAVMIRCETTCDETGPALRVGPRGMPYRVKNYNKPPQAAIAKRMAVSHGPANPRHLPGMYPLIHPVAPRRGRIGLRQEKNMDEKTEFRRLSGRFSTGVAVVTVCTPTGVRGSTVNSFASLSLDPFMVLFCLRHHSATKDAILDTRRYSINILSAHQRAVSDHFAGRGDRFDDAHLACANGYFHVQEANAWFDSQLEDCLPGGDHVILTGRVIDFSGPTTAQAPLIYHEGGYSELARPGVSGVSG